MDPIAFLDILDGSLSDAELSELCRRFGVAFGAFPGNTKRDKIREFLGFVRRQGRMAGLAEVTVAIRPDLSDAIAGLYESKEHELSWLDQVAGGEGQPLDSGLTWRWSASSGLQREPAGVTEPGGVAEASIPTESQAPSSTPLSNPYLPGEMVTTDAMFFGRRSEREQVRRLLLEGAHVAIVGGRSMGASSLLHSVAREISDREGWLSAYIDLKDPAYYSPAILLNAIWTQWWGKVRPGHEVPVRTLAEFVTAVRKLDVAGFRPLLFLDELEQLAWRPAIFNDEFFGVWHELGREKVLGLAITAHSSPADLLAQGEYNTRLYELFQQHNLGLLDEQAARDLLAIPPAAAGLAVPEGAVEYLYLHAGPHPFFLQLAGHYLFDSLARSAYSRGEVIRQFEIAAEPYWQETWESLSPLAQAHYPSRLVRTADGMGGRQLRILANRGLVIGDESGFQPFSDGFARWLSRMQAALQAAASVSVPSPF